MKQPIAQITDSDVKRLINRDFANADHAIVLQKLAMVISDSVKGRNRIIAAILKTSNGRIDLLDKNVEIANNDYRDIIAIAEYPNYTREIGFDEVDDNKEKRIIELDALQYREWMNRK